MNKICLKTALLLVLIPVAGSAQNIVGRVYAPGNVDSLRNGLEFKF